MFFGHVRHHRNSGQAHHRVRNSGQATQPLRTGLLLLLLEESEKGDTRHLGDLETNTGNVTLGVPTATETGHENLVVLIDEVEATIVGNESSNLLAVLDELHTNALAHSGVGLLGLDTDLLEHNPLGVRAAGERLGPLLAQVRALVPLVSPVLLAAHSAQLATGTKATRLTLRHIAEESETSREHVRAAALATL